MAEKSYTFTITDQDTGQPKTVVIEGPSSLTRKQAESVFKQQYNTLKSMKPGKNLLDSGRAGVDFDGVSSALGSVGDSVEDTLSSTGALDTLSTLANQVPVEQMDTVDFVSQANNVKGIGKQLGSDEVTAMMAQTEKSLGQTTSDFSAKNGLGKYGFSPEKLEEQGFLKPGTTKKFLNFSAPPEITDADILKAEQSGGVLTAEEAAASRKVENILGSPTIWTGKSGAKSLPDIIGNEKLQGQMQQEMLVDSFSRLQEKGILTGNESPETLAGLVNAGGSASEAELEQYFSNSLPPEMQNKIGQLQSGGEYSVDFVKDKLPAEIKTPELPPAFVNTVKRESVDMQRAALSVNDRIQNYDFGGSLGEPVTVTQADKDRAAALNARGQSTTPEEVATLRNAQEVYSGLQSGGLGGLLGDAESLLGSVEGLAPGALGLATDLGAAAGISDGSIDPNSTLGSLQDIGDSIGPGLQDQLQNIFAASGSGDTGGGTFNAAFLAAGTGGWQGAKPLEETINERLKTVNQEFARLVQDLQAKVDSGEGFDQIKGDGFSGSNGWIDINSKLEDYKKRFTNYKKHALKQEPYSQITVDKASAGLLQVNELILILERIRLKAIDNQDRSK